MILKKDIQILRCFSIVIIMLFHLNCFKSGYLGVDIFIVISSYLNIKYVKEKNFIKRLFYFLRRINRIIPSSFLISTALLLYSSYTMKYDYEFIQEYKNTFIFSSNIYYYQRSRDYFDRNSNSFYVHYWYLSLQAQIYVLLIIPYIFSNRACSLVLFTMSIYLYYYTYNINRSYNYYILFPRMWEVIIGSINLSIRQIKMKNISFIFLIIYCTLCENMNVYDQCIFVLLTIFFLNSSDNCHTHIFFNRIFCHIGDLSYNSF